MKSRRRLYEQSTGTNVAGIGNYENKLMRLAFNNGCYKGFTPTKDDIPQIKQEYPHSFGEAYYKRSTNTQLAQYPNMYIIPNADGNSFRVSYRDDSGVEKNFVEATLCNEIKSTTNTVKSPDEQKIIDFLKNKGYKEWDEVGANEMDKYLLVNPATDKDVKSLLGSGQGGDYLLSIINQPELKTFYLYQPTSTSSGLSQGRRDLGGEAKSIVVDKAKNGGYLEPSEMDKVNPYDYERVDLSKPESYTGVLAGLQDYATNFTSQYLMYRPKGRKNLNPRAKQLVDFLSGATAGGWKPLDEFDLAERQSGELEKIDLSDGRYYSGNLTNYKDEFPSLFPKPYIIARKVDITRLGTTAGTLDQDNCRKYIEMYYDDMVNNEQKTAPSLEEKRRVETCLSTFKGRYPKLKDKIDQMMAPTSTRAAYRIKYSDEYMKGSALTQLGLRKKSKENLSSTTTTTTIPPVQQESRDRLLKNIISENLMKLKKKQLLERTLSSKNTYKY
jgi:hypothetical protein